MILRPLAGLVVFFAHTGRSPLLPVEDLGFIAAFCTTIAFIPQLVRVVRRRSAKDVSLPTFLLFSIGVSLWLIYGIDIGSRPVIASNSITLLLSLSILFLKLRYDREATDELKPGAKELKP
ncbi:MAG TPA: SemiSWEET transporter [Acidobacteriaceae bacterium]